MEKAIRDTIQSHDLDDLAELIFTKLKEILRGEKLENYKQLKNRCDETEKRVEELQQQMEDAMPMDDLKDGIVSMDTQEARTTYHSLDYALCGHKVWTKHSHKILFSIKQEDLSMKKKREEYNQEMLQSAKKTANTRPMVNLVGEQNNITLADAPKELIDKINQLGS